MEANEQITNPDHQSVKPIDAIEQAIKESIYIQLDEYLDIAEQKDVDGKRLRKVVEDATSKQCIYGSGLVVKYLFKNHANLFQKLFILGTEDISENSNLKIDKDPDNYQDTHRYAVMQDNEGVWYATSPSNQGLNSTKDYATTIITGHSLDYIVQKINERDMAHFPDGDEIITKLNRLNLNMPRGSEKDKIEVACIDSENNIARSHVNRW